jgi:hypothetical protein
MKKPSSLCTTPMAFPITTPHSGKSKIIPSVFFPFKMLNYGKTNGLERLKFAQKRMALLEELEAKVRSNRQERNSKNIISSSVRLSADES